MSELAMAIEAAIRDYQSGSRVGETGEQMARRLAMPLHEYVAERLLEREGPRAYGKPYLVLDRAVPELHVGIWERDLRVCVGAKNAVEIDKLYGPAVALPLRVELDLGREQWVVERQVQNDDDSIPGTTTWREFARVPITDEDA